MLLYVFRRLQRNLSVVDGQGIKFAESLMDLRIV